MMVVEEEEEEEEAAASGGDAVTLLRPYTNKRSSSVPCSYACRTPTLSPPPSSSPPQVRPAASSSGCALYPMGLMAAFWKERGRRGIPVLLYLNGNTIVCIDHFCFFGFGNSRNEAGWAEGNGSVPFIPSRDF